MTCRPRNVVGIATGYGLLATGSGDRFPVGGGENFRTCPDRPWGPPSLLYNGYRVSPRGKERPGRYADPSSPSSAVIMKRSSYTSTPPVGRTACTEPQCLYKGALYLTFIFHTIRFGFGLITLNQACCINGRVPDLYLTQTRISTRYPLSIVVNFLQNFSGKCCDSL